MKDMDPRAPGDRSDENRGGESAEWRARNSPPTPIRVGRTPDEIIAILDDVAVRLRPVPDRAAIGSALQCHLGTLTSALASSDPRSAMAALSVSRALAIGYLSVVRPDTAKDEDAATIMALILNLEASESIICQIERREHRARASMRRLDKAPGSSDPQ
jgi:hypothetical protein